MDPGSRTTAKWHAAVLLHLIGPKWYIFSPDFNPTVSPAQLRLHTVRGIANIKHILQTMRGDLSTEYTGMDLNSDGIHRRGFPVDEIVITGVGDELIQCQSLAGKFIEEFFSLADGTEIEKRYAWVARGC